MKEDNHEASQMHRLEALKDFVRELLVIKNPGELVYEINAHRKTDFGWIRIDLPSDRFGRLQDYAVEAFGRDVGDAKLSIGKLRHQALRIRDAHRAALTKEVELQKRLSGASVDDTNNAINNFVQALVAAQPEKSPMILIDEIQRRQPDDKKHQRFSFQLDHNDALLINLAERAFGKVVIGDVDPGGFGSGIYLSIDNTFEGSVRSALRGCISVPAANVTDEAATHTLRSDNQRLLEDLKALLLDKQHRDAIKQVSPELHRQIVDEARALSGIATRLENEYATTALRNNLGSAAGDLLTSFFKLKQLIPAKVGEGGEDNKSKAVDTFQPVLNWVNNVTQLVHQVKGLYPQALRQK